MATEPSNFEKMAAIDVGKHIEKKNGLSYLSWAWAVDQLLRQDPDATWEYHEPTKYGKDTYMVSITVTAFGKPKKMLLPVMDYKNKAVPEPDSFAINTAYQRCLVKAIALHGLGLYIYAGEDIPLEPEAEPAKPLSAKSITQDVLSSLNKDEVTFLQGIAADTVALLDEDRVAEAQMFIAGKRLDAEEKIALWAMFNSKQRSALKAKPTAEEFANTP